MGEPLEYDVLFGHERIAARVDELAQDIAATGHVQLIMVALLKGSFLFAADLARALHSAGVQVEVDFLHTSSYNGAETGRAQVQIHDMLECDIAGKTVLLVDDILDSGHTLVQVLALLQAKRPARILTCVLLNKLERRVVEITPDFVGFPCPNRYVFGYGMDYEHQHRALPYIAALK